MIFNKVNTISEGKFMERNVEVVKDLLGNKVVVIQDIRFKGKRAVRWSDVEKYLKLYLYDIIKIKKKRATFSSRKTLLSNKTHFL